MRWSGLSLVFVVAGLPVFAQDRAEDRRSFLDPATPVSEDPRRVPAKPGSHGPDGMIVIRGGRIFDGTGAPARPGTLMIEGDRILPILPPEATGWSDDARLIDATGKTVMPGLIDLHTHLTYTEPNVDPLVANDISDATLRGVERLRFYIESGITSVRDVASHREVPFRLKAWVAQNRIPGPRVFAAGQLITGTGGHGAEGLAPGATLYGAIREAKGPDDWREAVREQFKAGADVIKIASHFSQEEVKAAIEEAHALGLRVTCDCETFYIQWAVDAGVDCIEHPLPRTDGTIVLMAKRGVYAVPTLIPYVYIFDQLGGYYDSTSRRFTFSKSADVTMLIKMKRAGVKLGIGTDLIEDWFRYLPQPYITELKHFASAGFGEVGALLAATRTGAEILDMADKIGTLEPGKLADVLIVDGKPDVELDDLAKVDTVIRDGWVVVESGHVAVPRHVPAAPPSPTAR